MCTPTQGVWQPQLAVCLVSLFVSVCRSCVSSSSVQRPPIPRWCPVRAWLFFTFLHTHMHCRAISARALLVCESATRPIRDGRGKGRSPGSLSPMTPKQDFSTQVPFSQHAVHSLSRNPLWRFCAGWLSVYGTIPYLCGNPEQRKARATTRRQKRDTPSHLTVLTVSSSRSRTTKAQSARRDNKYKSAVSARELAAEP